VLSGRGLCDELITRPEESYRLCCVVVCDLETSRMGAPYIYDINNLKVNNLTLILLTWRKWWAPNNASKQQMGFNSGFKGLSNPITGLDRPWGFQEVEAPRFQYNRHLKVVRLSAIRVGRLYPKKYSWYSFRERLSRPRGQGAAGRIMSMKNSMTQSGIEPATFLLVAQCLNRLRYRVPPYI